MTFSFSLFSTFTYNFLNWFLSYTKTVTIEKKENVCEYFTHCVLVQHQDSGTIKKVGVEARIVSHESRKIPTPTIHQNPVIYYILYPLTTLFNTGLFFHIVVCYTRLYFDPIGLVFRSFCGLIVSCECRCKYGKENRP